MRVLIVGLGSIAKKHIEAIKKICQDAEIYALRSHKDAPSYPGVNDIYELNDETPAFDFAIISNPTSLHAHTILNLSKFHIPLFIEKPVFDNLENTALIKYISDAGISTYVACNLRFLGCLQYLRNHIQNNPTHRINEVNVYCGSYLPDWRPGQDYTKCYSAIPELGGGVNIDLIHDIDYTCWIFGWPKSSRGLCRNTSSLEIEAVDYANYTLLYPNFTASIILNYYRRDYKRTIEVLFEDETWIVDLKTNTISAHGNIIFKGEDSILDTYTSQIEYFLNCLRNNALIENDMECAYKTLKICLNYERS